MRPTKLHLIIAGGGQDSEQAPDLATHRAGSRGGVPTSLPAGPAPSGRNIRVELGGYRSRSRRHLPAA